LLKLTSITTLLVLAAVTAIGPLATDMYLPALPAIGQALGAGPDQVQLTLSLYMAGFAVAQLVCGPLSDRYGRKPVLLGGMAVFAVASLLCAFAPSIEVLLAGRFLQALGGAAGPVLGRAAVRDIFAPRDAGRVMSYMASTMALAPAVAPVIGGLLLVLVGWGSIFVFLALFAASMAAIIALKLPESLAPHNRQSIQPRVILGNFRMLLGQRRFMGYTLTNASAFAGMFAFLSGSSFVLIEFLDVAPTRYGLYFAIGVAGFVCGTLLGGRLSRLLGTDRLIVAGAGLCALGGVSMAALALLEVHSVTAVMLPQTVFLAGLGMLMPQTIAGALMPFPQCAGSASSLLGFIQMTIAASYGVLVGQMHDGTPLPMALAIGLSGIVTLASYLLLVRPGAPDHDPDPEPVEKPV